MTLLGMSFERVIAIKQKLRQPVYKKICSYGGNAKQAYACRIQNSNPMSVII
jgi:hypothetical protein